jgi:PAS domain S-box-containing protein
MATTSFAPQELQLLLDHLPQASFLLRRNTDGSIVFAHSHGQLARELRMTTDVVAGENPVQFFGSDLLRQQMIQAWSGQDTIIQFRFKRRQLSCHLEPLLSGAEVTEVIGTLTDVTEQRKVERKLSLFAHTLSSLNEAVSITDSDDFILYVNPAFCALYGYSEEEVLNKASSILWSDRNPKEVTEPILRDTLNGSWRGYLYNRDKHDNHFLIYLHTSAVRDENGDIIGCVGIAERVESEHLVPGKLVEGIKEPVLDFSQAKRQIEAFQPPKQPLTEPGMIPTAQTLKGYFKDAFILQTGQSRSISTGLWVTQQLDMRLLAMIDDQEPDEISSYRSLMVSGLLDQIVNHGLVSMPDEVLNKVHRMFSPFLGLNYNISGADPEINLGICHLSSGGTTLRFAGANISLFVDHNNRVKWICGESGGIQRTDGEADRRYFKLHTQTLQPGDCFYLVSNCLFLSNYGQNQTEIDPERLIDWISEVRGLPMNDQQTYLHELLEGIVNGEKSGMNFMIVGIQV